MTGSSEIQFFPTNAKQVIDEGKELRVKFGIDPTRDRLHLGHFVPLRLCRKLMEQGHVTTHAALMLRASRFQPMAQWLVFAR